MSMNQITTMLTVIEYSKKLYHVPTSTLVAKVMHNSVNKIHVLIYYIWW